MILYFTGSGNSKYVADIIAEVTGDVEKSIGEAMKSSKVVVFDSDRPFVIVAPIYAWRLPLAVEDFLRKAGFTGSRKMYFVVTMGAQTGACDKYCERFCKERGFEFMGLCGVPMPDNYVRGYKMESEESIKRIISSAEPVARTIAEKISHGEEITKNDKTPCAAFMSGFVNKMFNRFATGDGHFSVSDKCISCGKCAELCPKNDITMIDGKPHFGKDCMACYACIHHCPVVAIDIKGKTESHGRYVCPEYKSK